MTLKTILMELIKLLFSLSVEIVMTVVQSIIAAVSLYLLYRTIRLQNKANKTQENILEMEMKAKRAEYLPSIKIASNSEDGDWVPDGFGGTKLVGTKRKMSIKIIVTENILTKLQVDFQNLDKNILHEASDILFTNAFYKSGEIITLELFEFDIEKLKEDNKIKGVTISINFEDLIGNNYEQLIYHEFATNRSEPLPLHLVDHQ